MGSFAYRFFACLVSFATKDPNGIIRVALVETSPNPENSFPIILQAHSVLTHHSLEEFMTLSFQHSVRVVLLRIALTNLCCWCWSVSRSSEELLGCCHE